jgi:alkanesulfonate monooxygenase SsuD/methylene tetrahydromethanopterin reductase-like flavin-dependent oxidoreductase (luciferase family)
MASGSISLRVYPASLAPAEVVEDLRAQARAAEAAGFDGCMTSEHHAGFPNYLPNALLAATWLLEATDRIWAAPCPLVLPLRPVSQTIEDLAWTAQRFPGRLGAGVCTGALPVDFELAGVPFAEAFPRYRAALVEFANAIRGGAGAPLGGDPAVAALGAARVPAVAAVQAEVTAARAARLGLGILCDSLQTIERCRQISDAYWAAGGEGPAILIRRLWIGAPPVARMAEQMQRYRGYAPERAMAGWGDDDALISGANGEELAAATHRALTASGCDALNIRVFLAGLTPDDVAAQIARHGAETLPALRQLIAR